MQQTNFYYEFDPYLDTYKERIKFVHQQAVAREGALIKKEASLYDFASGHTYFGLHYDDNQWIIREWAPNASSVYLVGECNQWKVDQQYAFRQLDHGVWELVLPEGALAHLQLFKLLLRWSGGEGERIPAYAKRCVQDEQTKIFSAQVWCPEKSYVWQHKRPPKPASPLIYEVHIGMSTEEPCVGTFDEFRQHVLPTIKAAGYNMIQMMAVQEHPYYGSFGYHVSNFFAVSSRFGTPDELKRLVDEAHGMGISVIMDIVHSHSVKNELEGLGLFDGTGGQYFHTDHRRYHTAWDSLCFHYGKTEVLHFLLSNCKYWLEEYQFDGFRFDGVTSMLYYDHGLERAFTSYDMYFDGSQDVDALVYLMLANRLIHIVCPSATTIAEEVSGMPGLCSPVEQGGYGFDYRLAMGIPDYWIKLLKEREDQNWHVGDVFHQLTSKRPEEKTISYVESHDQALVGDKTIIFRLIDKDMYDFMSKESENLLVARGIALHKMLRLITLSTCGGGYLNFMGNEFGHPEWIDFPREGNGWSYHYARRQWSLQQNTSLRYHYLSDFDHAMLQVYNAYQLWSFPEVRKQHENIPDCVLSYSRGDLLFVYSFNPDRSFPDYVFDVEAGKYEIILSSDNGCYGGHDRVDETMSYYAQLKHGVIGSGYELHLYIPARTALVLRRTAPRKVL